MSILFADLVGFTTLSESRDAETVRDLLDRYFETATQIIGSYGGTIEKFIGDAVMAVWGAPTAFEDDAERAVRSALDLVAAVEALGHEVGAELQLRAGVLTGEAAVTLGATNQGMVAGDLVNTASRLQSVAPPGTVLVGEATYQAASDAIAFEPAGEQLLKGKAAPVPGVPRAPGRRPPRRGGPQRAARGAVRRARPGAADAQGLPPRDRRRAASAARLDHRPGRHRQEPAGLGIPEVHGRRDRGRLLAPGPLAGLRRGDQLLGARRDGPWPDRDHRVGRNRRPPGRSWPPPSPSGCPTRRSAAGWSRASLQLLGIEAERRRRTEPDRESLFAAWRVLFERIAEHGVVVLVFEDLQWADDGLLDFIDHILDWSRERPIYIITLARPELLDRRRDWGAGRRNFTSLVLEPLGPDRCANCSPASSRDSRSRSSSASSNAPRASRCTPSRPSGCSSARGSSRSTTASIDRPATSRELSVPASLHALIASRLDGLDAADRSLLQAASVIGKTFSVDALAAVSGLAGRRARRATARARPSRDADARSRSHGRPSRASTGSSRASIREVAYGTLAKRDRRRMHVAAARYFESLDDEGIAGALAEHYVAAYKAQPDGPEGAAVAAQARVALRGGGGARPVARFVHPGDAVPRAGPRGDDRSARGGAAPRRRRRGRPERGAQRGADRAHGPVARAGARRRGTVRR